MKYGVFKNLGTYKTLPLDENNSSDEFEYYFESKRIPSNDANIYYEYKIVAKDGRRTIIEINGWKSGSVLNTFSNWIPKGMRAEIADPNGNVQEVTITSSHPNFIAELIDKMDILGNNYADWNVYDLIQENTRLKKEITRLEEEIATLRSDE